MSSKKAHRYKSLEKISDPRSLPTTPNEGAYMNISDERRTATTSKTSYKSNTTSLDLTNSKRRRYPSSPAWDSQITLTQLVPKAETPTDVSHLLEYGEDDSRQKHIEVIDLVDDDENENDNVPCKLSNRKASRGKNQNLRFHFPDNIPTTTFKRRQSSKIIGAGPRIVKFGINKNDKISKNKGKGKNGNKTLTQMDFVRRYIPLPESDDDDLKLYDESLPTSKDNDIENTNSLTPRKRRKLNVEDPPPCLTIERKSSLNQKDVHLRSNLTPEPETPQRKQRTEIPSSQTPESLQEELIHSPRIRKIRRFSLEGQSPNSIETAQLNSKYEKTVKEAKTDSPQYRALKAPEDDIINSTMTCDPQSPQSIPGDQALLPDSKEIQPIAQQLEPRPSSFQQRTVIYDTEDDTDYGDLDDDNLPQPAISSDSKVLRAGAEQNDDSNKDHNSQNYDDPEDLPPIPNSGTDLEIGSNLVSDPALASEASLYYHRPAQYTQYPNGPVPIMNTQKIAELFPIEEKDDHRLSNTSTSSAKEPTASSNLDQKDALYSETATATPTQDEFACRSVQVVPESSPITRSYELRSTASAMAPPSRESVVLVESSQLVDKLNRQSESMRTGASLRRLFSTGEFLTDSVMESIPPPPWLPSQDSIGEPYSENDGH